MKKNLQGQDEKKERHISKIRYTMIKKELD